MFQHKVGNLEAYACENWLWVLYVNVAVIPDDRLHVSSGRDLQKEVLGELFKKINVIRELSMLVSAVSANILCASAYHKFSLMLITYYILKMN